MGGLDGEVVSSWLGQTLFLGGYQRKKLMGREEAPMVPEKFREENTMCID